MCATEGRVTAATVADHIVPLAMGGAESDPSNLQSLCPDCHDAKTRAEFGLRERPLPWDEWR